MVAVAAASVLIAGVGDALATHGDPQKELTAADNARAQAMLLRKTDLGPGFKGSVDNSEDPDLYCKALDESRLTLTGEAESPDFARGFVFISSLAQVYESVEDATVSWKQGTSAAGERCARDLLRREFAKEGVRLVSMRRIAFPSFSSRSVAYRIELSGVSQSITVKVTMDLVVLMHSRAQVALNFGSALAPVPRTEELRLARLTASRMAKAMRGGA